MLDPALIFLAEHFDSRDLFYKEMAKRLEAMGYVKDTFYEALIEREKHYPTGLEFQAGLGVAIPHVETEHCLKQGITFVSLDSPLIFMDMEEGIKEIPVNYVFMLTLTDPNAHIDILQSLFQNFTQESFFKGLQQCADRKSVYDYLSKKIIMQEE